jgi:hypothetical protein
MIGENFRCIIVIDDENGEIQIHPTKDDPRDGKLTEVVPPSDQETRDTTSEMTSGTWTGIA